MMGAHHQLWPSNSQRAVGSFYEMETAGLVRKSSPGGESRRGGGDPREQEVTDALIWLASNRRRWVVCCAR
jgi:hypothetical protein